jgi:hypothetical protein
MTSPTRPKHALIQCHSTLTPFLRGRITQGAGAVRGIEVFVELVGELALAAGFR